MDALRNYYKIVNIKKVPERLPEITASFSRVFRNNTGVYIYFKSGKKINNV